MICPRSYNCLMAEPRFLPETLALDTIFLIAAFNYHLLIMGDLWKGERHSENLTKSIFGNITPIILPTLNPSKCPHFLFNSTSKPRICERFTTLFFLMLLWKDILPLIEGQSLHLYSGFLPLLPYQGTYVIS